MKLEIIGVLLFAIGMLALDRVLRIQPLLGRVHGDGAVAPPACPNGATREAFVSPVVTLNVPCGVDVPTCPAGSQCGNGWCVSGTLNPLKERCPLPVLPA